MMNKKPIGGCEAGRAGTRQRRPKQSRSSKWARDAGKVNALTWGDLSSGYESNPGSDVRLRRQGSAEAIVPTDREGPNIERMSKLSNSQDEQRRPNGSDRSTTVQTKPVKPVGVMQRVELCSARDGRKSNAKLSVIFSVNRRMRTRMYGGVRGGG